MFIGFNDESHKNNCVGNFVIKEIYLHVFKSTDFNSSKSIEHL